MTDPMTFSDERLRTLIRRLDAGEITKGEFSHVMCEHQVDFRRFHRIGDEVYAEADARRGTIGHMADAIGWPALIVMGACYAALTALLIIMLVTAFVRG